MTKYVTQEHFDAAISDLRNENATRFDEVITILKRLDEERIFTIEWIRRIESDVTLVKKHLKLA
jgi:hypothetical protein